MDQYHNTEHRLRIHDKRQRAQGSDSVDATVRHIEGKTKRELRCENASLRKENARLLRDMVLHERALEASMEREESLRKDLSTIVCAILKRDGRDVTDITAMDRLAELHANEAIFLSNSN